MRQRKDRGSAGLEVRRVYHRHMTSRRAVIGIEDPLTGCLVSLPLPFTCICVLTQGNQLSGSIPATWAQRAAFGNPELVVVVRPGNEGLWCVQVCNPMNG